VLVVQEISGKFVGTGVWKMPTGVVDEVYIKLIMDQIMKLLKLYHFDTF
jgi:hypothetical protein